MSISDLKPAMFFGPRAKNGGLVDRFSSDEEDSERRCFQTLVVQLCRKTAGNSHW